MATLATGLLARFGRAGFAPAGFHQEVSPFHLRFLPFHAFPSAITSPAVVSNRTCTFRVNCASAVRITSGCPSSGIFIKKPAKPERFLRRLKPTDEFLVSH